MSQAPIPVPREDREFPTGARRDADHGKPRLDYLPWRALRSLGGYMRETGERFGPCNYKRGMPLSELNASMLRHAADYQTARSRDEAIKALHGVLFNACVSLEQILLERVDLDDRDVIRHGAAIELKAPSFVRRVTVADAVRCDRPPYHEGPCSGFPRATCPVPAPLNPTKKERRG